jgi:hypothetical protein
MTHASPDLDPLAPRPADWPAAYTIQRANREAANRRRRIRTRTDRIMRHRRPATPSPRWMPDQLIERRRTR